MTATPKMGRVALELLPVVLVPVAFLAASPWLKTTIGGPMVSLIGAAVAIFVMGYANSGDTAGSASRTRCRRRALGSPRNGPCRPGRPRSCCS